MQAEEAIVLAAEAIKLARAGDSLSSAAVAQRVWGCSLATQTSPGGDDAEAHLMESLRLFELGGARIEAAHTRVALGELYAARGNARAAHGHLAQAATQFEASGLVDALTRTHRLIAALH